MCAGKQNAKAGSPELSRIHCTAVLPVCPLRPQAPEGSHFVLHDPHPPCVAGHTVGPLQICSACSNLRGNLSWMMALFEAPVYPNLIIRGVFLPYLLKRRCGNVRRKRPLFWMLADLRSAWHYCLLVATRSVPISQSLFFSQGRWQRLLGNYNKL